MEDKKTTPKETKKTPAKQEANTKPATAKPEKAEPKKETPKKTDTVIKATENDWAIVKYPHLSEKSISNIETQNKIVFIVKRTATRTDIKNTVESMFDVKVDKVSMMTTAKGHKKAYVRLKPEYSALDIATRLGMM